MIRGFGVKNYLSIKDSFRGDILPLRGLYNYIVKHYHSINGGDDKTVVNELREVYNDQRKRKFNELMLRKADLNIVGFKPVLTNHIVSDEYKRSILQDLNRHCKYEKTKMFFLKSKGLHNYFEKNGGNLKDAIKNAERSIVARGNEERDYTYSEIGKMQKKLASIDG